MSPTPSHPSRQQEFWSGVRQELPLQLGVAPFGLVFGVLGLAAGLTPLQTILMSSIVFGGASQVVLGQLGGSAPAPGVGAGGDTENTDWDALGKSNPRGRVGSPEDIAGLAIFLSSRACGFTVGDVITCDGGSVVS